MTFGNRWKKSNRISSRSRELIHFSVSYVPSLSCLSRVSWVNSWVKTAKPQESKHSKTPQFLTECGVLLVGAKELESLTYCTSNYKLYFSCVSYASKSAWNQGLCDKAISHKSHFSHVSHTLDGSNDGSDLTVPLWSFLSAPRNKSQHFTGDRFRCFFLILNGIIIKAPKILGIKDIHNEHLR